MSQRNERPLFSRYTNSGETTVAFGYDDANRQVWEDQTVTGYATHRVQHDRDADGNASNTVIPGYYLLWYNYTQRNQLAQIQDGNGAPWFNFTYDAVGNMTKRQGVYGGVNDSMNCPTAQYDPLNRSTMWENTGAADSPFARSWYQYDNLNREVATWRDEQSSKGERFGYNVANQMTMAIYNADNVWTGNPGNWSSRRDYNYTPDLLNRASVNDNGYVAPFANNALNQYTSVNNSAATYDGNFNLTSGVDGLSATYDAASHLVSASRNGNNVQFTYDGLGRCLKRIVNGVATIFVYDGWKPLADWAGDGSWSAYRIYGAGADEVLWLYDSRVGYMRVHSDVHGNISWLLDWGGNGIEKYTYDAFGQPTITDWSGNVRSQSAYYNRFMFQGREWIPELGIYDYRHRMYHPQLGRFLQMDPSGFDAGDMNLFRYVSDDPIDRSDPTGLLDTSASIWNHLAYMEGGSFLSSDQFDKFRQGAATLSFSFTSEGGASRGGQSEGQNASMRFVPRPELTEDNRYYINAYHQLTSGGKPVAGYDYFAQEQTTVKVNNFTGVTGGKAQVRTTDNDPPKELGRGGLFRDRVGLWSQPSSRVSGKLILDQKFSLKYKGQDVHVSTVLRHVTEVNDGNVTNSVIVLTP